MARPIKRINNKMTTTEGIIISVLALRLSSVLGAGSGAGPGGSGAGPGGSGAGPGGSGAGAGSGPGDGSGGDGQRPEQVHILQGTCPVAIQKGQQGGHSGNLH